MCDIHALGTQHDNTNINIDAAAEAFEERLVKALNESGLMLLLSLGHRTGLLSAMAGAAPETSVALAMRTDLDERYVREWLGGMVASGVVETDPQAGTYWLPEAHALLLTDRKSVV